MVNSGPLIQFLASICVLFWGSKANRFDAHPHDRALSEVFPVRFIAVAPCCRGKIFLKGKKSPRNDHETGVCTSAIRLFLLLKCNVRSLAFDLYTSLQSFYFFFYPPTLCRNSLTVSKKPSKTSAPAR